MDTKEEILGYIMEQLVQDDTVHLKAEDNLFLSGLIDSMGAMQLIDRLQKTNQIKIAPSEITLNNFQTVNTIVEFIAGKKRN